MSNDAQLLGAQHALGKSLSGSRRPPPILGRSSTGLDRQHLMLGSIFAAPVLAFKTDGDSSICLLVNGELHRLFRDDGGQIETARILAIRFSGTVPTAGCFVPGIKGGVLVCTIAAPSLRSSQSLAGLSSRISLYVYNKEVYVLNLHSIAVKLCTAVDKYATLLGYGGELFFLRVTRSSISVVDSFPTPHSFATSLLLTNEKKHGGSAFHSICRLLMLSTSAVPLTFSMSMHVALLYPNGAFVVLRNTSVEYYALLQPSAPDEKIDSASPWSGRVHPDAREAPIIKPTSMVINTKYIFVGFANSVFSLYAIDQIKRDLHTGKLATPSFMSLRVSDIAHNNKTISHLLHQDDDRLLHKGISALHPVYLSDRAESLSPPQSRERQDIADTGSKDQSVYLTELLEQPAVVTEDLETSGYVRPCLGILVAVANLSNIFLFQLLPRPSLRALCIHAGHAQSSLSACNIAEILFLDSDSFTSTLYVQLSNGLFLELQIPEPILLRTALQNPPLRTFTVPATGSNEVLSGDIEKVAEPRADPGHALPNHPLVASAGSLANLMADSAAVVERLFPYSKYHPQDAGTLSVKAARTDSGHAPMSAKSITMAALLANNSKWQRFAQGLHTGQLARSHPASFGALGPHFSNLLGRSSPLIAQAMKAKKNRERFKKNRADAILSTSLPNERVYHQVALSPAVHARSRFVLSFLPSGNPIVRSLDGMTFKPNPVLASFNSLLGGHNELPMQPNGATAAPLVASQPLKEPLPGTLRPNSPTQSRYSPLIRIHLPMTGISMPVPEERSIHNSLHSFLTMRAIIGNSFADRHPSSRDSSDLPYTETPNSRQTTESSADLSLSCLDPREHMLLGTDGEQYHTPLSRVASRTDYYSNVGKAHGSLHLHYVSKRSKEVHRQPSFSLYLAQQALWVEREAGKQSRRRYEWSKSGDCSSIDRLRDPLATDGSEFTFGAMSVKPAKMYIKDGLSRKHWLMRQLGKIRPKQEGGSDTTRSGNTVPDSDLSFFVVNINDILNNPAALEILKLRRISVDELKNRAGSGSGALLLGTDGKLGYVDGADVDRHLDQFQGYPATATDDMAGIHAARQLTTSHSGIWDLPDGGIDDSRDKILYEQEPSAANALIDLVSPAPAVSDSLASKRSEGSSQQSDGAGDPLLNAGHQGTVSTGQSELSKLAASSEAPLTLHDLHDPQHEAMIDDSGNLVIFPSNMDKEVSTVLVGGNFHPVSKLLGDASGKILGKSDSSGTSSCIRELLGASEAPLDGISLDDFPYRKLKISHEKYDLLCLCTYRGPLPQVDDETKRFLHAMEQRSRCHLGVADPGPAFQQSRGRIEAEDIAQWRQVADKMVRALEHTVAKRDVMQRLYREVIRRVINNISRLSETNCVLKVVLGEDRYYSSKHPQLTEYSFSSPESSDTDRPDTGRSKSLSYSASGMNSEHGGHLAAADRGSTAATMAGGMDGHILGADIPSRVPEELSSFLADKTDEEGTSLSTDANRMTNSLLAKSMHIEEPSVSDIDICGGSSPQDIDLSMADSEQDGVHDRFSGSKHCLFGQSSDDSGTQDDSVCDHFGDAWKDRDFRYVIHRYREKVLFDIYAEDLEYSDNDPIYTEDNPKHVPRSFTKQQYKELFGLGSAEARALLQVHASEVPSIYAQSIGTPVTAQLWFMKTGYQFFPLEEDDGKSQPGNMPLRNPLTFQRVRLEIARGDNPDALHHDDIVRVLDTALPDGDDSDAARIEEETPEDLDPDLYETNMNELAYEDMTADQKLRYFLNEPYVDATNLYLGATLDELGYHMKMRGIVKKRRSTVEGEDISDLMAGGLGFVKPRMPADYIPGKETRKYECNQAGGRLLAFSKCTRANGALQLSASYADVPIDPELTNRFYQLLNAQGQESAEEHLAADYKRSLYYYNPLVDILQRFYLARDYIVIRAYYSNELVLVNRQYTRSLSAAPWLGRARKKQTILDLWHETYEMLPRKDLWDSTLALKRASPVRTMGPKAGTHADTTAITLLKKSCQIVNVASIQPVIALQAGHSPQIRTFYSMVPTAGTEHKKVMAELSKAELHSADMAKLFGELFKIERLETEKHLADLYDVANLTGHVMLYGFCVNVMLFAPYMKNVPLDASTMFGDALIDEGSSVESSSADTGLSPCTANTIAEQPGVFVQTSVASMLLDRKTRHTKERQAKAIEASVKARAFELESAVGTDIASVQIPFDMRFDYKDLRPGRCYYCAGTFIEIPLLPPYKFEKECSLAKDLESFVRKQARIHSNPKRTGAGGQADDITELTAQVNSLVEEEVTLYNLKFLHDLYPVLYTNFTELLLSKRMKRMNINADTADIASLITGLSLDNPHDNQELSSVGDDDRWHSMMVDSLCTLNDGELGDYEVSRSRVATEVIEEVNDLEVHVNTSIVEQLQQLESPTRVMGLKPGKGDLRPSALVVPLSPCMDGSGLNVAELSPDNRVLATRYRNIIEMQTDHVFDTNHKYYEHITAQGLINGKNFQFGLMPIKAIIRDVLFECLASMPPLARFIAKKLVKDGMVFRVEELQMIPFVLLQAQLLSRPAKDLFRYLRYKMHDIYEQETQARRVKALEDEFAFCSPYPVTKDSRDGSNTSREQVPEKRPKKQPAWKACMRRPCSQLLGFDDNWDDQDAIVCANKRLFDYCTTLLYQTRLAPARTRQLLLWKLRQISKRDRGAFRKDDAFKEVASKYNNIATSTAARNNLAEALRFSLFYEASLRDFSGIIALGRRPLPTALYLLRVNEHFVCIYEDFPLQASLLDKRTYGMRLSVLGAMRREGVLNIYALLRIYGYKYMDDALLSIKPKSLLLTYPLSLIVNIHSLQTILLESPAHALHIRSCLSLDHNEQPSYAQQTSLENPDPSAPQTEESRFRFCLLLLMTFITHQIGRLRPGYSFLTRVVAMLYDGITQDQAAFCTYALTLFEMRLRINNAYVTDCMRLSRILGPFNVEVLLEWFEVTFRNVYLTNREVGQSDVVNQLQKQQTMLSTLVSFAACDTNTTHLNVTSISTKAESTTHADPGEGAVSGTHIFDTSTGGSGDTQTSFDVSKGLVEGMRQLISPVRYQTQRLSPSELMKIDNAQLGVDEVLERAKQHGQLVKKVQVWDIEAIRAELDMRMQEFDVPTEGQNQSSTCSDYEPISDNRDQTLSDDAPDGFADYAETKRLTERIRTINRNLSPISFRMTRSMDLATPIHELKSQYAKIQSIRQQHELNETLRLSSTSTPAVAESFSSILATAQDGQQKQPAPVEKNGSRELDRTMRRTRGKNGLEAEAQTASRPCVKTISEMYSAKHTANLIEVMHIRGFGYKLSAEVHLPAKLQGAVQRILTPQPGRLRHDTDSTQVTQATYPRRPYSILGHIPDVQGVSPNKRSPTPLPPDSAHLS